MKISSSAPLVAGPPSATSSMITEMVKGKTLAEAEEISNRQVAEALRIAAGKNALFKLAPMR